MRSPIASKAAEMFSPKARDSVPRMTLDSGRNELSRHLANSRTEDLSMGVLTPKGPRPDISNILASPRTNSRRIASPGSANDDTISQGSRGESLSRLRIEGVVKPTS